MNKSAAKLGGFKPKIKRENDLALKTLKIRKNE